MKSKKKVITSVKVLISTQIRIKSKKKGQNDNGLILGRVSVNTRSRLGISLIIRTKLKSYLPNSLQVNNRNLNDPFTIRHELNEHFCNIGHKLAANTQTTRQHNSTMFFGQTISNSLCLNSTDEFEIMGIINNLNANKSPGHDELPILFIKESKYAICSYLTNTINKCLLKGHYPDILKIAKVTSIFKRGQRNDPNNYRPVSVLSPFNKIFELVIKNRLLKLWKKYNIFSPTQFGFRKGLFH